MPVEGKEGHSGAVLGFGEIADCGLSKGAQCHSSFRFGRGCERCDARLAVVSAWSTAGGGK